jgi:hypothetical protein
MKDEDADATFYLATGSLLAIALGFALIPLRSLTSASNLAFPFIALTIAVAEFGGRGAALATALTSALSLDFFLTQPYLRLTIHEKQDIIAFVELAVCGLIAAAFRSQRGRNLEALTISRKQLDLLHSALKGVPEAAALEPQLANVLEVSRDALPLAGAAVRDPRGYLLASSTPSDGQRPVPETILEPDSLLPANVGGGRIPRRGAPLPEDGGRIAITLGSERLGWLDVWGNGARAGVEARHVLSDLARLFAMRLAAPGGGPDGPR